MKENYTWIIFSWQKQHQTRSNATITYMLAGPCQWLVLVDMCHVTVQAKTLPPIPPSGTHILKCWHVHAGQQHISVLCHGRRNTSPYLHKKSPIEQCRLEIYKKRTWTFRFDDSKGMMTYTNKSKKKRTRLTLCRSPLSNQTPLTH